MPSSNTGCKDGRTVWADTVVKLQRDPEGNPAGFLCSSHDITAWKVAEEALKEADQRYRMITEHMHDAVWLMDMDLRTTWVTPSVIRNRGYSFEELRAMPLEEHLTPASLQKVMELVAARLTPENLADPKHEILVTCELEYTLKGGGTVWGDTTVMLIRDSQGAPSQFLCTEHDITDRKKAEAALRESEAKYRLIAENVSDVIWLADMKLNLTYVSPSITRVRGYSVQEAMAQKLGDRLTPASLQRVNQTIAEQLERRRLSPGQWTGQLTIELEQYRRDGSTVWTENEINYIVGPEGQPVGIIGVTRDISKRKRIEIALRESEERFRSIIQSSSDVIMILDGTGRATYESPSAARILGYRPDFFIGRFPTDLIHPDDRPRVVPEAGGGARFRRPGPPDGVPRPPGRWLLDPGRGRRQQPARQSGHPGDPHHRPGHHGTQVGPRGPPGRRGAIPG